MKVTVRKSNMAKFGTKTEEDDPFQPYAERRPKTLTDPKTEDKISKHALELRRKIKGDNLTG